MFPSNRLLRITVRTILQAIPMALLIVVANFLMLQLAPGDVVDIIAAESDQPDAKLMADMRREYGLDQPVLMQLWAHIWRLLHLELGVSPRFGKPVLDLILQRLPATLQLMGTAFLIAIVIGTALGVIMASWHGRKPDRITSITTLILYSIPNFWIGLMFVLFFSVYLGLLPTGGSGRIGASYTGLAAVQDRLRYLVLPALTLAIHPIAVYARLTRTAMLEVRNQDFVRTAIAKGLHPVRVTVHHVLRNALLPLTTAAGMHFAALLSGAVVTETVFAWPGIGRLMFDAINSRDFVVLLGVVFLSSLMVIVVNAFVDVLQAILDPRIEAR